MMHYAMNNRELNSNDHLSTKVKFLRIVISAIEDTAARAEETGGSRGTPESEAGQQLRFLSCDRWCSVGDDGC